MATDEGDTTPSPLEGEVQEGTEPTDDAGTGPGAVVGSYTWDDFLREHDEETAARNLYQRFDETPGSERWGEEERSLTPEDWERTDVDPAEYLGFPPWEIESRIAAAHRVAADITDYSDLIGYEQTPAIKDIYGWEDYKRQYFYDENGDPPQGRFDDEPEEFDPEEALGFPPETIDETMADCHRAAEELEELIDERTVDVDEEIDEDAFFSDPQGRTTVANRYDLEKTVPMPKKQHFVEKDRYWVNKPYSFVVIFRSTKENEIKYYVIQPHLTEIEKELSTYLTDKLRASIKYEDEGGTAGDEDHRRSVIEGKTRELLARYDLYEDPNDAESRRGLGNSIADKFGLDPTSGLSKRVIDLLGYEEPVEGVRELDGIQVRPESVLLEEDADTLNEYQVEKLLYYLERDFIGYERIDGIKHDINVEDISCDGYNSPVFVYHSDYEQIITNVYHGEEELDDFVVKLAQRSGKGISKRRPQVDATLPDGSRAQLTLGREVSDHGTNYTIRQFKDVPFTPVDLINWQTFSLDQMAFLWLCIENHKSLIFAGGTASGKTTSLNAVSLFIPSNTKIVSIEDTREVELPQRNWIASVTRPSFSDDDKGDVDEFDLLEAALRQRPDYIVMGEIRGEEGRTLFQVMSTGHTTYTTFHADNVGEVLKRFTTEPINVSKTMFTALDLVSIQTSTRVQGHKVRRNKSLTEINHYDAENDEINVQDVYQWQAETDEFLEMGNSNTLDEIMFDRGWDRQKLDDEIFKRQTVLAYLIYNGLNTYTQVAATFQAFINDPETILSLMANDQLESSLEDLREMESVLIDIDPEKEEMVPRPDPNEEILAETRAILDEAEERLFEQYRGETPDSVADALLDTPPEPDIEAAPDSASELPEPSPDDGVEFDDGDDGQPALDDEDGPAELDDADETSDEAADPMPELEAGEDEAASAESAETAEPAPEPTVPEDDDTESAEESEEESFEPPELDDPAEPDEPAEADESAEVDEPAEAVEPVEPTDEDADADEGDSIGEEPTPAEPADADDGSDDVDAPFGPAESDAGIGEPDVDDAGAVDADAEDAEFDEPDIDDRDPTVGPSGDRHEPDESDPGSDEDASRNTPSEDPATEMFGSNDSEEAIFGSTDDGETILGADDSEEAFIGRRPEEASDDAESGNGDGVDVDSWGLDSEGPGFEAEDDPFEDDGFGDEPTVDDDEFDDQPSFGDDGFDEEDGPFGEDEAGDDPFEDDKGFDPAPSFDDAPFEENVVDDDAPVGGDTDSWSVGDDDPDDLFGDRGGSNGSDELDGSDESDGSGESDDSEDEEPVDSWALNDEDEDDDGGSWALGGDDDPFEEGEE